MYGFRFLCQGDASDESDLDVLIDIEDDKKVGLRYLVWHKEIEGIVKKKVQVVSNAAVSAYIRPFIDADKILLYEK